MKRWLATVLVFGVCSAVVRADVTVAQTSTLEGGMAAMSGAGAAPSKITVRVKGMKSRSDVEIPNVNASTITDLVTKQLIMLKHDPKTAQVIDAAALSTTTAPAATATVKLDGAVTPTGKSQVIDGIKCDEFTFTTTMSMSEMTGSQLPPEAAEAMKDLSLVVKGSTWVAKEAPGAAEYVAFQKAALKSDLANAAMRMAGVTMPGMDKMLKAMASVDGVAYLTVMDMTIEGTGPIADMMRQVGAMKLTTKVTSVTTSAISDDVFKIPEGYTVVK